MKQLIVPVVIIVALIAFFVVVDRKKFSRYDVVLSIQGEIASTNRTPSVSVPETKRVTEVKPGVKTKPVAEAKPITETKVTEAPPHKIISTKATDIQTTTKTKPDKPAEAKPVAETKTENKVNPAAVAVVTAEEAEKLNAEALVEFEIQQKRIVKEQARLEHGFGLAFSEQFEVFKTVSLTKANEDTLKEKNYDVEEFKKREIPAVWTIDYSTIPTDVSFKQTDNGYSVVSPQGSIRFMGQRLNGMRSSFLFELTVKNTSDNESEIIFGVHDSGLIKNGYKTLVMEKLKSKEEKTIEVELSVFEQLASIAPTISVKGALVLSNLSIYKKDHDNFTVVEGEIVERSELPDPQDTDYPDCRFSAHFVGNAILSGMPCNKELSLSIDGFLQKTVLPTNDLKKGDKIQCALVPIDSVPDNLASIQETDDLALYTLDSYLVSTLVKLSKYTEQSDISGVRVSFKSESFDFKSCFGRGFNPAISDKWKNAQKLRVENDLRKSCEMINYIEKNRDEIEQKFQTCWTKEKDRFHNQDDFNTIKNEKGIISFYWRNVCNSFWCLPPNQKLIPTKIHSLPKYKIDALLALRDFLESNGILLIVSLIPDSYDISSRVINHEFIDIPDYQFATYVKQLSEVGIECPYNVERILKNYNLYPFCYLFPYDFHPGATVQQSIAEVIEQRLQDYNFPKVLTKHAFSHVEVPSYGDQVFPVNCDIGSNIAGESYSCDEIRYNGERLTKDETSEILVIGNSVAFTPGKLDTQHSLPAFLSEVMLHPVDDYIVPAHGPMTVIIQRFFEKPESFLLNKKIVILQLSNTVLRDDTNVVWKNIADMDKKRMMINGKKLIATLPIRSNGNWADSITHKLLRSAWIGFVGKNDIMLINNAPLNILNQNFENIDLSKPLVCVVPTIRSPIYNNALLSLNGIQESIPATHYSNALYWQDIYYHLPAGTNKLKLEIQGKEGTIVGFNYVLVYQ